MNVGLCGVPIHNVHVQGSSFRSVRNLICQAPGIHKIAKHVVILLLSAVRIVVQRYR